jgi:hypothetical protein
MFGGIKQKGGLKELNKVFYYKYGRAKNFSAL